MPQVPQYHREVSAQLTPTPEVSARLNGDMFGANVAQAQGNLGKAIGDFNNGMIAIKNRIDNTKIMEMANVSHEWEEPNLFNKDTGYLYKFGKDAYGQSESLLKDYDKYMDDYIKKSNFSPEASRMARATALRLRERIEHAVISHDYKQGVEWSKNEAQTAQINYLNTAVNFRNNPQEINKAIQSGFQAIEMQGEIQHLDNSAINLAKMKYRSDVHEAVFSALLGEGSMEAGRYLEAHKNEIDPSKLPHYIAAAKNNELNYTARATASSLLGLTTEQAYSKINAISDPQTRDTTMREYNTLKHQQNQIQTERDNQLSSEIMQEVYQLHDSGNYSMGEIMTKVNHSDMSLEMKEKIYKNLKEMQELENVGNNWADYNTLLDMAGENHEMFLQVNPATYNLTKDQYNKIVEMQRKGANVKYSTEAQLKEVVKSFSGFNPATQHDLSTNEYRNDLVKFLSKLERLQGEAFDIKHIDEGQLANIIQGFEYKDENAKNKNIDETKELYMRAKKDGEIYERAAYQYAAFKQENKREPKPDEIYEMVKRSYNAVETEYKQKAYGKITTIQGYQRDINNTVAKEGETKVLTYFADSEVPKIERELGLKLISVQGSRYREGDTGGHGKGRKLDISMSEHTTQNRIRIFEKMLANPLVTSIGTSDPILLKRFEGNTKIRNLNSYDANYQKLHPNSRMNHVNHIDISLNTTFGGSQQGSKTTTASNNQYMTSANNSIRNYSTLADRPSNFKG